MPDRLSPGTRASVDAQTLAFIRALTRYADPDASEADQVAWAADEVRSSIDRAHAAIEDAQALHDRTVDEALAGAWCPGCSGVGTLDDSSPCPICGGSGHRPTPKDHP